MTKPSDERCDLLQPNLNVTDEKAIEQKIRKAMAIDTLRADRLLLASLQEDDDARQTLFEQMPVCPSCYRGVMVHLAGRLAAREVEAYGDDSNKAIAAIDAMVAADIDKLQ